MTEILLTAISVYRRQLPPAIPDTNSMGVRLWDEHFKSQRNRLLPPALY